MQRSRAAWRAIGETGGDTLPSRHAGSLSCSRREIGPLGLAR
ncbi:hypothetical protein [Mycetohabitans rhizoxinica]